MKVFILSGYGFNCEEETKFAFEVAGATCDIVHINDWIKNKKRIFDYQMLAIPGGFSYGDDTGSGNAMANKIRNHLWEEILEFVNQDKLVIGICNGFQVLVNLGLLPSIENNYGKRTVALLHNNKGRYLNTWINIKIENDKCVFTKNISQMFLPIAHGEGNFFAEENILQQLNSNEQIVLRYCLENGFLANQIFPFNPNGAIEDVAGICSPNGKIFGLMPHPERAIFFTQRPDWNFLKEKFKREKKEIPKLNDGIEIFRNAVNYFK